MIKENRFEKVFIIAEIGNTHEGSVGLAKKFILAAKNSGADAVKFQTHIFEAESLNNAPSPPYFNDETREEYFRRTSFNLQQLKDLKLYAESLNLVFLSSPFSLEAFYLLEKVGVEIYKIPSGEVTNSYLLEKISKTNKPVLLSSGMSTWDELTSAINILQQGGCSNITLLQCTSEYPCPPEKSGLNVLNDIKLRFPQINIGYSDHTLGNEVAIASVVLGAKVIEKHFTLSKLMYGSDAFNSSNPKEFKSLVISIRNIEKAINNKVDKDFISNKIFNMKTIFEKSIVSATEIKKGEAITINHLAFKKPGDGIKASNYKRLIGMKIKINVTKDYKFKLADFE